MPKARVATWLLTLSLAACAPKGTEGPGAESGNKPPEGAGPKTAFGDRCTAQATSNQDGTIVSCDEGGFSFVIPTGEWTVDKTAEAPVVVSASFGKLSVSVQLADAQDSKSEPREHLDAVYRGVEKKLASKGGEITSPKVDGEADRNLVVSYQVTTSIFDATLRAANAWTTLRGKDGSYVDYHASWAASADDPAWKSGSGTDPEGQVKNLANAFFVTE